MSLVIGPDGEQTCQECAYDMCSRGYECRVAGCECHCGYDPDLDPQRARDLDDRDPDKLHVVANDVEREARQADPAADYEQLRQERFKPPRRRRCRSCGAPIIWATTTSGKAMPVDADPVAAGNLELSRTGEQINVRVVKEGAGTHVSHYVTCPHANQWRPPRRRSA